MCVTGAPVSFWGASDLEQTSLWMSQLSYYLLQACIPSCLVSTHTITCHTPPAQLKCPDCLPVSTSTCSTVFMLQSQELSPLSPNTPPVLIYCNLLSVIIVTMLTQKLLPGRARCPADRPSPSDRRIPPGRPPPSDPHLKPEGWRVGLNPVWEDDVEIWVLFGALTSSWRY